MLLGKGDFRASTVWCQAVDDLRGSSPLQAQEDECSRMPAAAALRGAPGAGWTVAAHPALVLTLL